MKTVNVHFTIPIRFGWHERGQHPVVATATPDDWFDVAVVGATDTGQADLLAREHVNHIYGNTGWMSTYLDGPRWEDLKKKYAPGRCVATIEIEA